MRIPVFLSICMVLAACAGGRPDERLVESKFAAECPNLDLVSIVLDEDEAAARTFVVRYRDTANGAEYEEFWLYFNNGTWDMQRKDRGANGSRLTSPCSRTATRAIVVACAVPFRVRVAAAERQIR